MSNIPLVLVYQHFSLSSYRPMGVNMIEIGGLHVGDAKKLPENFQEFLDSATEGAIIFSMGSIIQGSNWEIEKREAFVKVFSQIKQKVIWKYENETLPNKPENVMITSWLPQRDILAHKNVRAFITHGGLLGVSEAISEGVPFIGIPIFSDQYMNVINAAEDEYGILMNFDDISEKEISKNINEIIHNPKYRKNAKELSRRFNDRPMSPEQLTTYWVEYVIRHNGTQFFKSPAHNLNFLQRHSIDSYLTLIAILSFFVLLIKKVLSFLFSGAKNADRKLKRN